MSGTSMWKLHFLSPVVYFDPTCVVFTGQYHRSKFKVTGRKMFLLVEIESEIGKTTNNDLAGKADMS